MSNIDSLNEIVEAIVSKTNYSKAQIQNMINEKMDEFEDLVTELGAAHIVAKELGVNFSTESSSQLIPSITSINSLTPQLNNVSIQGRIQKIYSHITFNRKDGEEGILQPFLIEDKSGSIRVVLWGKKVYEFQQSERELGTPVRLINGYTREGKYEPIEFHLNDQSHLQFNPNDLNSIDLPPVSKTYTKINQVKENSMDISLRCKIIDISEVTEFMRNDGSKGKVRNIFVGDDTGRIRISLWDEKTDLIDPDDNDQVISVFGINAKRNNKGYLELHSSKLTNIKKVKLQEAEDFHIKKATKTVVSQPEEVDVLSKIKYANKLISITGLIVSIRPLHKFQRSDGSEGMVRNIRISDKSGTIRVVLWDENAQKITDANLNTIVTISGGYTKENQYGDIEVHCGNKSLINTEISENRSKSKYEVEFKPISDISPELKEVHIKGLVTNIYPIKSIVTKDGKNIQLQSFRLADSSGEIRLTCWRNNIKKLNNIGENEYLKILNARVKENDEYGTELTITGKTIVKKVDEAERENFGFISSDLVKDNSSIYSHIKDIADINENEEVTIQATIAKVIDRPFVFPLCPDCKKKLNENTDGFECKNHGRLDIPEYLLLFSFIANDGTGNVRVVCGGSLAEKIIDMSANEAASLVKKEGSERAPYLYLKEQDFEDNEYIITGLVKNNSYFDALELKAKTIDVIDYTPMTRQIIKQV